MATQFKRLRNIAAVAFLTVASSSAFAGAVFTVDPTSNGLTTANSGAEVFQGDQLVGGSSARVTYTGNNANGSVNYKSVGYIQYSTIRFDGSDVGTDMTGLGSKSRGYGLYATFEQTFTCSSLLQVGSSCAINSIKLSLYGDRGADSIFNKSTLTNDATVTATGDQVLLGTVDQIIAGAAGFNALGGAFQNINSNFELTAAGSAFFVTPNPFYSFAYSAFNNTTLGLTCSPTNCNGARIVAINSESGTTDFNDVPEPAPLALMGIGLLGMAAYRRKQAKK